MFVDPPSPLPATEPENRARGRYGAQNLGVCAAQVAGWAGLLTALDHAEGWVKLPLLFAFCALMQGVFSMMHEFFHGNAHRDRRWNAAIGVVGATIFGTSATLHRINHWGHHVRNRTRAEQGEFIHAGESAVGKVLLYDFATLGGLWLSGLLFPFVSLVLPYSSVLWLRAHKDLNTYSAAFERFGAADWRRMRAEALGLAVFWGALLAFGPWRGSTIALAYAAFAYHWSVLQWVYHVHTPFDVVEGAYNLRLPAPLQAVWLNFNHNLTHHRRPDLPWQELPSHTELRETQPLWWRHLRMWLPPTRYPAEPPDLTKTYF